MTSFSLWKRRPALECGLRAMCEANTAAVAASGDAERLRAGAEVGSLVLVSQLPLGPGDAGDMVMAARLGRLAQGQSTSTHLCHRTCGTLSRDCSAAVS